VLTKVSRNSAQTVKGKRRWLRVLTILFAIGLILFLWARPDQWRFRRELPWRAQDVKEWHQSDGFLPDYSYQLKAKITEEQFHRYIAKFELTPHTPTRKYSDSPEAWLTWHRAPGFSGAWWDPSDSLEHTFVWQGNDTWTFAKYERGYLYLASLNH
jgi:hypothetical protein